MPHAGCTQVHDTRAAMTADLSAPRAKANHGSVPPPRTSVHVMARPRVDGAALAAQLAQERLVTLELQHAILPLHDQPFDLPGLRVALRYLPASRDSRVGGDWYITADMPQDQVLVAIGDVGGHGLTAAAGMARLRGALAGLGLTGSPPHEPRPAAPH